MVWLRQHYQKQPPQQPVSSLAHDLEQIPQPQAK
jgi:hypothetical protein